LKLDDALDLVLFIGSLTAMAWGLGCELSPAWSAVIVGAIVAGCVLMARVSVRFVGRKQPEKPANESA
jgi:hypothetical protein